MAVDVRSRLGVSGKTLAEFCRRWKIRELSVFGSVLREDFRADSDIDVLVTFAPEAEWSLIDHAKMQAELSKLLGRSVHAMTRPAIERSRNPYRRKEILETSRVIYAA